jgi:hypothetical protein
MDAKTTSSNARRILVFGSPLWAETETAAIRDALARVWHPEAVLVVAAAERGAAALAAECWTRWGGQVELHWTNWAEHRGVAPRKRCEEMIAAGGALCLGFGSGTTCVELYLAAVEAAGIRTELVRAD